VISDPKPHPLTPSPVPPDGAGASTGAAHSGDSHAGSSIDGEGENGVDRGGEGSPAASGVGTSIVAQSDAAGGESGKGAPRRRKSFLDRVEAYISRLSTRNNFWHRITSLIWLPFAFRSGIKRLNTNTFTAILPFRRFNRNWYNAMAGAALLGNSEIAGGMYVFGA